MKTCCVIMLGITVVPLLSHCLCFDLVVKRLEKLSWILVGAVGSDVNLTTLTLRQVHTDDHRGYYSLLSRPTRR